MNDYPEILIVIAIIVTTIILLFFQKRKWKAHQNEVMYESLFNHNQDGIIVLNPSGKITKMNSAAQKITGYASGDRIWKDISTKIPTHELEVIQRNLRESLQGIHKDYQAHFQVADGRNILISVKHVPIMDAGKVTGVFMICKDITERVQLLQELNETNKKLNSFFQSTHDAIDITTEDGILTYVNPAFEKMFGWEKEEVIGKPIPFLPDSLKSSSENWQKRLLKGEHIEFENQLIRKDGSFVDAQVTLSPFIDDSGVIQGIAAITKDITEQKKLMDERQQQDALYRLLTENSSDIIALYNGKNEPLYVSPACLNLLGYTPEEYMELPVKDVVHQDDILPVLECRKLARLGQADRCEFRMKKKNGEYIWLESVTNPILSETGEVLQIQVTTKDVHEHKISQLLLKENEERYRHLIESSPEPIAVHIGGVIVYSNLALANILRATSREDIIGRTILDFVHPDYQEEVIKRAKQMTMTGYNAEFMEEKLVRLDGSIIDAEVAGIGIVYNGKPAVRLVIHDITKRKQAEKEIIKSEERYRLIAENSTDLIRVIQPDGLVGYASPSHKMILGYQPEELENKHFSFIIHPDDVAIVLENYLNREKIGNHILEYRMMKKDGSFIWVEAHAAAVFNEDGSFKGYSITSRDISLRKRYEEQLQEMAYYDTLTGVPNRRLFQDRLAQTIKHSKRDHEKFAVMYLDCDRFKWINDTFGHETGDQLLIGFTEKVLHCIRESDTLARLGGDEFAIIVEGIHSDEEVISIASRIIESLQVPWNVNGNEFMNTTSIGIAVYPNDANDIHNLLAIADQALYQSKENGRNQFHINR